MNSGEPVTKKTKLSIISDHVFNSEFQKNFAEHWQFLMPLKSDNLEVIPRPFRICKISNFLRDETVMDQIKDELYYVKTRRNSVDLYQFEQSNDLVKVKSKHISELYQTFKTDMVNWMESNMNLKLNKKISMSSNSYTDTDYLLCHDDKFNDNDLGDRKIAFIFYLSKDWTAEDGGSLDLFDTNEQGRPRNIVRSLVPEYNSLIFFEVVDHSYHQVSEVLSPDKSRWSISGWFYIDHEMRPEIPRPELQVEFIEPLETDGQLDSWISTSYLDKRIKQSIQHKIEEESYNFLSDFIIPDMYNHLSEDLESANIRWKRVGPADVRNYEVADENTLPPTLSQFYNIFKTAKIFQLLKDYTELDLISQDESMKPKMTIELQRWSRGCYTLVNSCDKSTEDILIGKNSNNLLELKDESFTKGNDHSFKIICDTPPSDKSNDEIHIKQLTNYVSRQKFQKDSDMQQSTSSSKEELSKEEIEILERRLSGESSDIAEYLSDHSDADDKDFLNSQGYFPNPLDNFNPDMSDNGDESDCGVGSLDVILQFHTDSITNQDITIDYIDVMKEDCALIHIPAKQNHMCLVYKKQNHVRLQKYVNHYCNGYFYNLICTYYE